jgi:hypothetical protein
MPLFPPDPRVVLAANTEADRMVRDARRKMNDESLPMPTLPEEVLRLPVRKEIHAPPASR